MPIEARGSRLDVFLIERFELSRSLLAQRLRDGLVTRNGKALKPGVKLKGGEVLELAEGFDAPPDDPGALEPEDLPLTVLHAEDEFLVIDKEPGRVVHPGAGVPGGTLVNALLHHEGERLREVGAAGRPGLVHRLDRGTSGVMVVARTRAAHAKLSAAFADRRVEKRYLALAHGDPAPTGRVDAPIARDPQHRTRMRVSAEGRVARSSWAAERRYGRHLALLEVGLETGRTHQVRVHLAHQGHPLVGDEVYGPGRWKAVSDPRLRALLRRWERPALHARRLVFPHPSTGEPVGFEAPLPADLVAFLESLEGWASGS